MFVNRMIVFQLVSILSVLFCNTIDASEAQFVKQEFALAIKYPDYIKQRKEKVDADTRDVYQKDRDPRRGALFSEDFKEGGAALYRLALKIATNQPLAELDFEAVKSQINERHGGITLMYLALSQYNLNAVDFLMKYGADLDMSFSGGDPRGPWEPENFYRNILETMHPGFSIDVIELYVKHGFDPNHLISDRGTFLAYVVMMKMERGWKVLLKAGGNPWKGPPETIPPSLERTAVDNAIFAGYFPFLDYMLQNGYFSRDQKREGLWAIRKMMEWVPSDDPETPHRIRIIGEILTAIWEKPDEKMKAYLAWKP